MIYFSLYVSLHMLFWISTSTSHYYFNLLGVPLPLYGMVAYGLVSILGLRLQRIPQNTAFDVQKKDEMILIGITTSMAVATAYFLYILSTEFGGESCLYCLTSSALTFSLFFITLKVLLSSFYYLSLFTLF